jgi:hypothetical protein
MTPRQHVLFSTNPLNWTYPYVAPVKRGAAWQLPGSFVSSPTGDGTDVD